MQGLESGPGQRIGSAEDDPGEGGRHVEPKTRMWQAGAAAALWATAVVMVATLPEGAVAATDLKGAQKDVLDKLDDLFTYGRNICIGLAAFSFLAFGVMLISGKFNPKWMWTSLAGVGVFGIAGYVANEFVQVDTSSVAGGQTTTTLGGGIKLSN